MFVRRDTAAVFGGDRAGELLPLRGLSAGEWQRVQHWCASGAKGFGGERDHGIENVSIGEREGEGDRALLLRDMRFADFHVASGQTGIRVGEGGDHLPACGGEAGVRNLEQGQGKMGDGGGDRKFSGRQSGMSCTEVPLTPALSRRERENGRAVVGMWGRICHGPNRLGYRAF